MPLFGLLGNTKTEKVTASKDLGGRRKRSRGSNSAQADDRIKTNATLCGKRLKINDETSDSEDSDVTNAITTVEEVAVALEHVMGTWLDPCGMQYAPFRKQIKWSASRDEATLSWIGFDRLDARKLAGLRDIPFGRFRIHDVCASLQDSAIVLTVVSAVGGGIVAGDTDNTRVDTVGASEMSTADLLELREIRSRWAPVDDDDMNRIMAIIRTVRSYIRENAKKTKTTNMSYDLYKKYTAYDVLVKGFDILSCRFLTHMINSSGHVAADETARDIQLWIDFESSCLVVEILKNKIPIN